MIRILCFSTATAGFSDRDLDIIVTQSEPANAARDVTGVLAFNGRNFCQVLEGEERAVRDLITRIAQDPRHGGFKVLEEKQIDTRYFDGWSMRRVRNLDFNDIIAVMKV